MRLYAAAAPLVHTLGNLEPCLKPSCLTLTVAGHHLARAVVINLDGPCGVAGAGGRGPSGDESRGGTGAAAAAGRDPRPSPEPLCAVAQAGWLRRVKSQSFSQPESGLPGAPASRRPSSLLAHGAAISAAKERVLSLGACWGRRRGAIGSYPVMPNDRRARGARESGTPAGRRLRGRRMQGGCHGAGLKCRRRTRSAAAFVSPPRSCGRP